MGRNRLANETSPYLRQHADNPVDWYPWGDEAFARARSENKPILLSIGYSSCHWCHVMAHESFENAEIAALMNSLFVNVKVDREERPDVDDVYMRSVQLMIQRGGWPLTVFLTPTLEPFHGGTYFPPVDRHGLPAFPRLLRAVSDAYREKPDEVGRVVSQIMASVRQAEAPSGSDVALDPHLPRTAATALLDHVDEVHGGLGQAPKFPHTQAFQLMLRQAVATGDERMLGAARLAGERMAAGGMYDQIGGGFHRYSVDAQWLVPHFEKMLYDNVQLPRLYLELYQRTGDPSFRTVAEETLDYLCRELQHEDGGLFCATDADSEGTEGTFFIWTKAELVALLPPADVGVVVAYYGVTEAGNFEGSNVLHRASTLEQAAAVAGVSVETARGSIARARAILLAARARRVPPERDEKILTGWNALAVATFAAVGSQLRIPRFVSAAERIAHFVWTRLREGDHLLHGWARGIAKGPAFLDDHAYLAEAFIELFQSTGRIEYLDRARDLVADLERRFHDDQGGGYFYTPHDGEVLVARTKPGADGSVPSGNAVAALALLKLHALTGEEAYAVRAHEVLAVFHAAAARSPFSHATYLEALELYTAGSTEIVIVGSPEAEGTKALWNVAARAFVPHRLSVPVDPDAETRVAPARDRPQIGGQPTAYVCRQFSCSAPVTDAAALATLLAS